MELYWSYTGAINYRAGVVRGGVARPLAAVGRRTGQVSGRAERGWSLFLWLRVLEKREEKEVKETSPATGGREETKIPKIPKIPIVIYVIRWSKQLH